MNTDQLTVTDAEWRLCQRIARKFCESGIEMTPGEIADDARARVTDGRSAYIGAALAWIYAEAFCEGEAK